VPDCELHLAGKVRWGRDNTFIGTFVENYSINGSLSRQLDEHNAITVSAMAATSERALRGCTTDEVFQLIQNVYGSTAFGYTPSVGVQNGKTRNANTTQDRAVLVNVNHTYSTNSDQTKFKISLSAIHNKQGYSTLARFDSDNPYPDYYAYLPSHHQGESARQITELWQMDKAVSQIDWNGLYQINYSNRTQYGARSKHIIEQRLSKHNTLRAHFSAQHSVNRHFCVKLFVDAGLDRSDYCKVVDDLLGGDYWLDIDTYLVDDVYYGDLVQNNMLSRDRRVGEGETFGYDYSIYNKLISAGIEARYRSNGVQFEAQYSRSKSQVYRLGRYEKETFPGALSLGRSEKRSISAESFNLAADYVTENGVRLSLRLATGSRIPAYQDIFLAQKNQNRFVDLPLSPRYNSAELSVSANRHWGAFRVAAFSNRAKSVSHIVNQYDVITTRYSQFVTGNLSTKSYGVELETTIELTPQVEMSAFFSKGKYQYDSNPIFRQYDDRDGKVLNENIVAHLSGRPVHYSPENLLAMGIRWQPRYGLWFDAVLNYSSVRSAKMDMIRRTDRILTLTDRLDVKERLLAHTNLNEVSLVNIYVGKRFNISSHWLSVTVGINNLTNCRIERYGYEQYHLSKIGTGYNRYYDAAQVKKCYDYGRSINFSISYAFN
jgi:hypothetical protein